MKYQKGITCGDPETEAMVDKTSAFYKAWFLFYEKNQKVNLNGITCGDPETEVMVEKTSAFFQRLVSFL